MGKFNVVNITHTFNTKRVVFKTKQVNMIKKYQVITVIDLKPLHRCDICTPAEIST